MSEEKFENMSEEEKMRAYFKEFIDIYVSAAKKASLPVDREKLERIMDNAQFEIFEREGTTATFAVNKKLIQVIINNFRKNGADRNNFLLFHEFTHLITPINEELFGDGKEKIKGRTEKVQKPFVDALNASYGVRAIDEVLAQWCCEELNDAAHGKKRQLHEYNEGPLGADITYRSDFSDNDIYSPLEESVEKLVKKLGYNDLREFATEFLSSGKSLIDMLDDESFKILCQIGVICRGIYKENGMSPNSRVTKEDVETAYKLLNREHNIGEASDGQNLSEINSGGDER